MQFCVNILRIVCIIKWRISFMSIMTMACNSRIYAATATSAIHRYIKSERAATDGWMEIFGGFYSLPYMKIGQRLHTPKPLLFRPELWYLQLMNWNWDQLLQDFSRWCAEWTSTPHRLPTRNPDTYAELEGDREREAKRHFQTIIIISEEPEYRVFSLHLDIKC